MPNISAKLQPMQHRCLGLIVLFALAAGGCQTTPTSYPVLAERISTGDAVAPADLRRAFIAQEDFKTALDRLTDLETQALQLADDEPLKLGSLGTAILDIYYGSLAGHYVMQRFYEHVENPETALIHANWAQRIRDDMSRLGDGSLEQPYPAVTAVEPVAYARSENLVPVGSIYRTSPDVPFTLLMQARPKQGNLRSLHFNLQTMYDAIGGSVGADEDPMTPFELIAYLARRSDTAAQAAIGAYLASHDRYEDAAQWLRASSRSGNVLANNLLARVFWQQAQDTEEDGLREEAMDLVMENYLHAIALGSTDAAYALGVLYLNDHYGEENQQSGVPLLHQAMDADHPAATLYLAHLHYSGDRVEKDHDVANDFYRRAAELQHPGAQRAYARFLLDRDQTREPHTETASWLESLAEQKDAEAMILLGNLWARGIGVQQNPRRAVRWFERAVDAANNEPHIVNEVAWTLAVTDIPQLMRSKYAQEIMDSMMGSDEAARARPEFLDTWAATYAANDNFERAVELQSQALEKARATEQQDMIEELEAHLDDFKAGRALIEPVP